MQSLHKILSLASAGAIRKADIFLDLDCSLFRVCYNDGMENDVWQAFPCQEQAEDSASEFIHCEN